MKKEKIGHGDCLGVIRNFFDLSRLYHTFRSESPEFSRLRPLLCGEQDVRCDSKESPQTKDIPYHVSKTSVLAIFTNLGLSHLPENTEV